jgi:cell division septation protein DedD
MAAIRIRPALSDSTQHAQLIGEKVVEAWYGHHGSGYLEIPAGVVAALAFVEPPYQLRDEVAVALIKLTPAEFADFMRHQWRWFMTGRPDLINRIWPLAEPWIREDGMSEQARDAAKHAANAALQAGQLSLTGDPNRRCDTDLLGVVLTLLRPKSALQGRGQYYTPGPVLEMMARILGVREGESIHEPTCGTGGAFRAAAEAVRATGGDPTTCLWVGVDIDHVAVACCAVNVVLWGLGTNVLLGVGDSLRNDWWDRAIGERRETVELVRQLRRDAAMLKAFRLLSDPAEPQDEMTSDAEPEPQEQPPNEPPPASEPEPEPVGETAPDPEPAPKPAAHVVTPVPLIDLDAEQKDVLAAGFWDLVDLVVES